MAASGTWALRREGRGWSLVLAAVLLTPAVAMPAVAAASSLGDYRDDFSAIWYANSQGSIDWSADAWIENGDDDSASTGAFHIGTEPHCSSSLCLIIGKDGADTAAIKRSADLAAADAATLTFQYKRHKHVGGDVGEVRLQIATSAAGPWTTLDTFPLDATDPQTEDYERVITPWISTETTVRFRIVGGVGDSHINIGDFRIELFGDQNVAPVLDPIPDQTIAEEQPFTFTATASDENGDILEFKLDGNEPAGAAITPGGVFTWTPTEAQGPGEYSFDVIVCDNSDPHLLDRQTVTLTVEEVNVPPTLDPIGDRSVDEGTELTFLAGATDPDTPANGLDFSLTGAPAGASITQSGTFRWTPSDAQGPGMFTFDVVVTDDGSPQLSDSKPVTVTVAETNIPPTIQPIPQQSVEEGATLQFTALATDPDTPPNSFVFSVDGAPAGATISPGGQFLWTPSESQGPGTYHFDVVATDDGSPPTAGTRAVTIVVSEVNTAPTLAPIPDQEIEEGTSLTILTSASDRDQPGNTLTFSLIGAPEGAAISQTGLLTWTPLEEHGPGVHEFEVKVMDNGSPALFAKQAVTITVLDGNNAPVIDPVETVYGTEGSLVTFTATATDPDQPADEFTFSLTPAAPSGAVMTPGGVFTWIPGESRGPGTYEFDVKVTDDGVPTRSGFATARIVVAEFNAPPTLEFAEEFTAEAGVPFRLVASATDPDIPAQSLRYEANGLPEEAEFSASGVLDWTPASNTVGGQYLVWITVTDDGSPALSDTAAFRLNVISANLAPGLIPIADRQTRVGETVAFTAVASDPDGAAEDLRFSLSNSAPVGAAIDAVTGRFTWTPQQIHDAETHSFSVIVTDSGPVPKTDSAIVNITVGSPNAAPIVSEPPDQRNMPGDEITLYVASSDPDEQPQPLTFSAVGLPPGLDIDPASGAITGTTGFDGIAGSPHAVTIKVYDGQDVGTANFMWSITGVDIPLPPEGTKSSVMTGIAEVTARAAIPTVEPEGTLQRSLVIMSRAARAGISEMSLPFFLLFLAMGLMLAFGRVGLVPVLRRGDKHEGVLRRFDLDTGCGIVVRSSDDTEVFVHASAIARRDRAMLEPGDRVEFRTIDGAYRDLVTRLRRKSR